VSSKRGHSFLCIALTDLDTVSYFLAWTILRTHFTNLFLYYYTTNSLCSHDVIMPSLETMLSQNIRKLSYCIDDCAMHPIYGCPKNFWESLSTLTATFAKIFNGLLFRSILWMCIQNLKFVAFPIPEIIGVLKKFVLSLDTPTLPFLPNFSWAFVRMDLVNVPAKFEVRSFTRSWDNSDCSFGLGLRTPILGKERP